MSMFGGVESNLIEIGEKTRRPMLEMRRSVNSRAKQCLYDVLTSWAVRDATKCSIADTAKGVSRSSCGNAGSEASNRNGALRSTRSGRSLTGSVDDERRHRSALPTGTEARAPQKAKQPARRGCAATDAVFDRMEEDAGRLLPFHQVCARYRVDLSQGDMGRRALFRIKYEAANGIHPRLVSSNHTRDGSR